MKTIFCLLTFSFLFILVSCAQTKSIIRVQAFSKESVPGRPMNGIDQSSITLRRDTLHLVFIEIRGQAIPTVDSTFLDGEYYSSGIYPVHENEYLIGVRKTDGHAIILTPAAGNRVWRIELTRNDQQSLKTFGVKKIIIKGRLGKKKLTCTTDSEVELAPDIKG